MGVLEAPTSVGDASEPAPAANGSRQLSSYAGSQNLDFWSGKLFVCPNEMVPLQIDLAIGLGRYRFAPRSQPNLSAALRRGGRARLERSP